MTKSYRPIVAIDFDGVIHSYSSGWKGAHVIPDAPVPGAIHALHVYLDAGFEVAIFSSRSKSLRGRWAMRRWMADAATAYYMETRLPVTKTEAECVGMDFPDNPDNGWAFIRRLSWPWFKPAAALTIDDRAACFTGSFPDVQFIKTFQPWNKRRRPTIEELEQILAREDDMSVAIAPDGTVQTIMRPR